MLVQGAAEIICDVIFSVRESTSSAESAHDGAGLAVDAALYFISVNGTFTLFKRLACLENGYFKIRS